MAEQKPIQRKWGVTIHPKAVTIHEDIYTIATMSNTFQSPQKQEEHAERIVACVNLLKDLSLEELQALKPERVKASNELYDHLKTMCDAAEIMSCWDKMPNDAYYKAKRFLKEFEVNK